MFETLYFVINCFDVEVIVTDILNESVVLFVVEDEVYLLVA